MSWDRWIQTHFLLYVGNIIQSVYNQSIKTYTPFRGSALEINNPTQAQMRVCEEPLPWATHLPLTLIAVTATSRANYNGYTVVAGRGRRTRDYHLERERGCCDTGVPALWRHPHHTTSWLPKRKCLSSSPPLPARPFLLRHGRHTFFLSFLWKR